MSDEVEAAAVEAEVDTENPESPAEGETKEEEKKEEKEGGEGSAGFSVAGLLIRLVQLTFAVISFAVMASANNFDNAASFNLIIATGVIITAWVLVAIGMECAKSSALSKVEIAVDFILSELALASFCAAGATQSKLNSTIFAVDPSRVICAIFFMMFTWIAMSVLPIMSAYSSWTETYCIPGEGTAMAQCLALADEEETPAEE